MKLLVIAVGHRMPAWVEAAFTDYAKRMPRESRIELVSIKPEPRTPGAAIDRLTEAEARRIRAVLPRDALTVVLDQRGHACSTKALAERLQSWKMRGRDVAFVIGGPDGLAEGIRHDADWQWSLGLLTLPHGLVRVIVAEQLYRASSILRNHPYHRE